MSGANPADAPSTAVDAATAERIEHERVRAAVEAALALAETPPPGRERDSSVIADASDALVALGPPVVPFLEAAIYDDTYSSYFAALHALGRMPSAETQEILLQAIERYDAQSGGLGLYRVQWGILALAMQGRTEALDVLDALQTQHVAGMPWGADWTTLDVVTGMLGEPGRKIVLGWVERVKDEDDDAARTRLVRSLDALARNPAPEVVAPALDLLGHRWWRARRGATRILAATRSPAAVSPLLARIADPDEDPRVAGDAALAVLEIRPGDRWTDLVATLERTRPSFARGVLYRLLATLDAERAGVALRSHRGRPDPLDRAALMDAAAIAGTRESVALLREGVADPDVTVAGRAVQGLGTVGSPGAIETLLAVLNDPRWVVRLRATELLAERRVARAAPRIADRLLRDELQRASTNVHVRDRASAYGEALVRLRYTAATDDIRSRIEPQGDPELKRILRELVERLDRLRSLGDDVAAWAARLDHDEPRERHLAVTRLEEIGTPAAVRSLVAGFDGADEDLRVEILHALGSLGAAGAPGADLIADVLESEAYDALPGLALRPWAAWAAGTIGTADMREALERSMDRRRGLDAEVVVQWARTGSGEGRVERVASFRDHRLRRPGPTRGPEQERLDRLVRDLRDGRSLDRYAEPPAGHTHATH